MKKILLILTCLSLIFSVLILYQKHQILYSYNLAIGKSEILSDSLQKALIERDYFSSLVMKNYQIGSIRLNEIEFYRITTEGQKVKIQIPKSSKEKFVVRYSEIGCNTCVNLIFKRKDRLEQRERNFDLIVLVDAVLQVLPTI